MSFWNVTMALLEGMVNTGKLFVLTLLFALPLGFVICWGSMSRTRIVSIPVRVLVWIVRGSPLMLQILIVYYGPGLLFGLPLLPRFTAALCTFVLNYACYFSEIYRAGIESIAKGQYEAGQVLGMTKSQIFFKIVLMQVVKRILPPVANEVITLVKDTALARVIMIVEIIQAAQNYAAYGLMWPLFYTAVFYLVIVGLLTLLFGYFEKKLDYYKV